MSTPLTLTSARDGFQFSALHAEPVGRRRGGVIVIQEIFGLDAYVVADVERWAGLGFEALAPSMFDRQAPRFKAMHDPEGMQAGFKHAVANGLDNPISDVQACIDFLSPRGPVFIVGYCYGGGVAWRAAALCTGLSAASRYYGGQVAGMADLPLSCPTICHFGRKDGHIPADETRERILKARPETPVYIYENSGHGFNNDGRPDSDPADAALARQRTLDLFVANGAI